MEFIGKDENSVRGRLRWKRATLYRIIICENLTTAFHHFVILYANLNDNLFKSLVQLKSFRSVPFRTSWRRGRKDDDDNDADGSDDDEVVVLLTYSLCSPIICSIPCSTALACWFSYSLDNISFANATTRSLELFSKSVSAASFHPDRMMMYRNSRASLTSLNKEAAGTTQNEISPTMFMHIA